ncbi:MAG: hypothetical protein C0469_17235 [Cyanobacteria bacterium DS2.3.42]|nr:hypothetical protein [Cyanobacteria bacterium DS2.3.42]
MKSQLNRTASRNMPGMLKVLQDKWYLDDYRAKCAGIEKRPQGVHSYIQFNREVQLSTFERRHSINELRISQRSNFLVRSWRRLWRQLDRAFAVRIQRPSQIASAPIA